MEIDLDAYREQSLETWGQMAPGWQDRREWLMDITGRVNDWLVQKADPQPGQTILDIAAGTGDLGFHVAERVGQEGRVISTDFAPEMVDVASIYGARFAIHRGCSGEPGPACVRAYRRTGQSACGGEGEEGASS